MRTRPILACLLVAGLLSAPRPTEAFCGFYVSGADAPLFNNATQVVLMREGTRTVLSMQNNYQGPPSEFAMVVPVPVVLQKENVKTLPHDVFKHVDQLTAPRLVEYWEQDPCFVPPPQPPMMVAPMPAPAMAAAPMGGAMHGVKIEAQFTVGEYDVVILSAQDALGLDTWLRENKYNIPSGAEPVLRPYVQGGMKFFVAKVDPTKVKFDKGMATLSPLRFHYDDTKFSLPVRLGLLNSSGTQDLIVNIISRGQRFEVANYPNVTIPTNLDVDEAARDQFGAFYAALFDRTVEKTPRAAVTEYSWDAGSCDPCPTPPLSPSDLATLGADALHSTQQIAAPPPPGAPPPAGPLGGGPRPPKKPAPSRPAPRPAPGPPPMPMPMPMPMPPFFGGGGFVVTRIHARYTKESLGEDMVFQAAPPITGGREVGSGPGGKLEKGATKGGVNNFQARYAIRHPWTGPITCANPRRGLWGGPPAGSHEVASPRAATNLAFAPRGTVQLSSLLREAVPEIDVAASPAPAPAATGAPAAAGNAAPQTPPPAAKPGGCGGCQVGTQGEKAALGLGALGLLAALWRRRRAR
jgi:MYXO-CTERM domain-containing protein